MKNSLRALGEFGLIAMIRRSIKNKPSVRVGIGDDAAVLSFTRRKDLLFTTDMLVEGRHFRRDRATPFEIGWKAMAVNVSDIAAMGGLPTAAVVSAGFPKDLSVGFIREIYRGLKAVSRKFGVDLVGGDTNRAETITLSVAMLGEVRRGKAICRSGAKIGDVIFVTGFLGGSVVSGKHLKFTPRVAEARYLARHFKVHAMMDLSDGLGSDIHRLTEASRAGAVISEPGIPVSGVKISTEQALGDGEDFELLFTLSVKDAVRLALARPVAGLQPFHPVGKIVSAKEGVTLETKDMTRRKIRTLGFDHFR
ncbi:MAG: thiamine-phosphate kinase [Candidatus Omnitrophica bacterium]|nr:thiamine-phosphate kinase [Candidatus Omnitrophota bacterium]